MVSINIVTQHWARIVAGWVTVLGWETTSAENQTTMPISPSNPAVGTHDQYPAKLGE